MYNLLVSFYGGMLTILCLFILCFLTVIGGKIMWLILRELLKRKTDIKISAEAVPVKKISVHSKPVKRATPKRKTTPEPQRSIEINPDEIDKIYVRKI